jgi:hypothetical protein
MQSLTSFLDFSVEITTAFAVDDCALCQQAIKLAQAQADAGQMMLVFPSEGLLMEWRERLAALA